MISRNASANEWLARADLRPTRQRCALASLLIENGDRHLTAEALYEEAVAAGVSVSLATVYNALKQFTNAGLLKEIRLDAARVTYDTRTDAHAHYLDEATGEVFDAPIPAARLAASVPTPEGYEVCGVDVVVRLRPKSPAGKSLQGRSSSDFSSRQGASSACGAVSGERVRRSGRKSAEERPGGTFRSGSES